MADPDTANLAGANELFTGLISKLNSVRSSMEAGLEIDPSTLASTLGGDFTSLTSASTLSPLHTAGIIFSTMHCLYFPVLLIIQVYNSKGQISYALQLYDHLHLYAVP